MPGDHYITARCPGCGVLHSTAARAFTRDSDFGVWCYDCGADIELTDVINSDDLRDAREEGKAEGFMAGLFFATSLMAEYGSEDTQYDEWRRFFDGETAGQAVSGE